MLENSEKIHDIFNSIYKKNLEANNISNNNNNNQNLINSLNLYSFN